jgi:hypothetical protein
MAARPPGSATRRERSARIRNRANALLILSTGSLVAAVFGVLLGRSAIGEINPIYFQPREPVRAVEPASPPTQDALAEAYGWENGRAATAADCGANCAGGTYAPPAPPALRTGGPYWRDASPTTELPPWPPGQVSAHRETSANANIERYTHYPVAAEDISGAAALKVPSDGPDPEAADEESPPDDGE